MRPGKDLDHGGGWSSAIANPKTNLWHAYLDLDHFNNVCLDAPEDVYCTPGKLAEFTTSELFSNKSKAAVPFAMPVRLTDNSRCKEPQQADTNGDLLNPYCWTDFNCNGTANFCTESVGWTNPGGTTLDEFI